MNSHLFVSTLLFICLWLVRTDGRVVRLSNGLINGTSYNDTGQEANVFLGIPFARAPVGPLRFRKPQAPPSRWFGIRNADKYGPSCLGSLDDRKHREMNEDCLYVDVYADNRCMNYTNCSVVFLVSASPIRVTPNFNFTATPGVSHPREGVIIVVPSYRRSIFGFADFGRSSSDASSNVGLYDILAALKWTRHEVDKFGGDPNRITLVEDPSAAPLGQLLITSPVLDDDLLSAAVILRQKLPIAEEHPAKNATERILKRIGCLKSTSAQWSWKSSDVHDSIQCLRNKTAIELDKGIEKEDFGAFEPQIDGGIVAVENLANLVGNVKPINLLIISPMEAPVETSKNLTDVCREHVEYFGLMSRDAVESCVKHYAPRTNGAAYIHNDVLNSIATEMGILGASQNSSVYLGITSRPHFPLQTIDFFINSTKTNGSWSGDTNDSNESSNPGRNPQIFGYFNRFYIHLLHEFIHNQTVEHDWKPVNLEGENYYYISFSLDNDNTSLTSEPHFHPVVYNARATEFWLTEVMEFDSWNPFGDHDKKRSLKPIHRFHTTTQRSTDETESTSETSSSTTSAYTPWTTVFSALPTHSDRWTTVFDERRGQAKRLNLLQMSPSDQSKTVVIQTQTLPPLVPYPVADSSAAVGPAWTAFWGAMSLAIILAVVLLIISASKIVFRFQNAGARSRWSSTFKPDEERGILANRTHYTAYESF
ncbi:hypothetical protein M3Y94_00711400 [Aphelenchoides besseyi]|nr:hypothetical protein M3Y94_00711400 [Aphelenchoides besseyi]KAI6231714.1 Carboxylesterase, type B domain-containing protein [Aphelenchoides besseyi]